MLEKRLKDTDLAFLDVETTGITPFAGDRMCEIAVLRTKGHRMARVFSTLLNPGRPISPGASMINGITDDMVKDAPAFRSVAREVLSLLENCVIVGHNISFDLRFLASTLGGLHLEMPFQFALDTLRLARKNFRFASNSLSSLVAAFNVKEEGFHRALPDVYSTKRVFAAMVRKFGGWENLTVGDLVKLQGGEILPVEAQRLILPDFLEEALRQGRPLRIRYKDIRGALSVRVIQPQEVSPGKGGVIYLTGECFLRGGTRTFRLDRILQMNPLEDIE